MTIYIFLIFFLTLCLLINFKEIKYRKIITFIIFGVLTIIAALRSVDVGIDTNQYFRNFSVIANLDWNQAFSTRYEVGFFAFCKILSCISTNPQTIIIGSSLFIVPFVGYFVYKESNNVVLSALVYILLNLYFFNLTGMRQSLAISFIIISFIKYKNKKYFAYILNIILATLFHSSAIVFLTLPIIDKLKYEKRTLLYVLMASIICFLFSNQIFTFMTNILGKYSGYENSVFGVSNYFGALFQSLFYSYIFILCHIILTKKENSNSLKRNQLYLKLVGASAIFEILSMKMQIFSRVAIYFFLFSIILVPISLSCIKSKKNRFYISLVVYVSFVLYWLIIAIYRPEWNGAIPYSFFF